MPASSRTLADLSRGAIELNRLYTHAVSSSAVRAVGPLTLLYAREAWVCVTQVALLVNSFVSSPTASVRGIFVLAVSYINACQPRCQGRLPESGIG